MEPERYQRVIAAIHRQALDRVPWALWGHAPAFGFLGSYSWEKASRDGEELARAHIAFVNELDYKMDLLKVTPFYMFMAHRWGAKYRFINNEEIQENVDVVVKKTDDWNRLWVLDPKKDLREHLRAVSILSREIGRRMPFIYSFPSPFLQAMHHVSTPKRVFDDMKSHPEALKRGLETISQTCIEFSKACINEGATGIFMGVGRPENFWSKLNRRQLEDFQLYYDRMVLNALSDAPIKLLHICSGNEENPQLNGGLMEEGWFKKYPINAMNWWDASFTPCSIAKKVYGDRFCIISGLDQSHTLRHGTPKQVEEEVKASIEAAGENGGFIIGPGCTLSQDTPLENLNAVAKAVEKYGRYSS